MTRQPPTRHAPAPTTSRSPARPRPHARLRSRPRSRRPARPSATTATRSPAVTAARFPAAAAATTAAPSPAPARYRGAGLALILVAAFMVVLDFSIVNVALPSIQRELGFAASAVQWVVTGYAITFGGLLILGGRAADLFGRRRMFVAGLIVFSAASLAGGLAHDPVLLVVSRAVQGAGAALVAPAALSLITTGFPEGPERNRALGLYGATASVGFVAGQVLGGVLVQFTTWRAVFLVNVPVGIAAVLLTPRLLGRSQEARARRRLDVGGAALITGAIAALVFGVSQGGAAGWTSPTVLGALVAAAAAAAAFAVVERRHPDPLVRISVLRRSSLRKGAGLIMLLGLWNGGEMLVLSLYFQQVLHDSPLMTGLAIAPQGIVGFAAGVLGARLAARLGMRWLLVLTNAVATLGFLVLTQLPATGGYSPLLAAVIFIGFGTAGTAFGAMVTASRGVANGDQGLVGGVINTSRQIGAGVGAALLPAIALTASHGARTASVGGDRAAMLAGAVAAALATLVAWHSLAAGHRQAARAGLDTGTAGG
jgi:EmrB/QacA subfamily drug resistance transporter